MENLVEEFDQRTVACNECKKDAVLKCIKLNDTKPNKVLAFTECPHCGFKEVTEDDYIELDYSVKINADFTSLDPQGIKNSLKRMAFINHNNFITLSDTSEPLITFSSSLSSIDCLQGLFIKAKEILESNLTINPELSQVIEKLEVAQEKGFKIEIRDNSGYTRICPFGVEYTDVDSLTVEEFNLRDSLVKHEIVEKNSLSFQQA